MYYYDKKIYDTYTISELFVTNTTYTKGIIEICNNEEFKVDMSTTKFGSSQGGVNNVELNKIIIDWGDGTKTKLNRPINHTISTISNFRKKLSIISKINVSFIYIECMGCLFPIIFF